MFEKLQLSSSCHQELLMTPDTVAYIKTNRDGSARMSFVVLTSDYEPLVKVNRQGLVSAGARTGQASVQVTAYESFGVNQTLVLLVKVGCCVRSWGQIHRHIQLIFKKLFYAFSKTTASNISRETSCFHYL